MHFLDICCTLLHDVPMSGKQSTDYRAQQVLTELLADRGLTPRDVAEVSLRTGHPGRTVSERTVYRVLTDGHVPRVAMQFEIAATIGLLPSHIWGRNPIPANAADLPPRMAAAA